MGRDKKGNFMKLTLLVLFGLSLAACSHVDGGSSTITTAHMSYDLTENGCATEEHAFSSADPQDCLNQYCAGLENDSLNHGCALDLRLALFNDNCPGNFNPSY
jgi:hypothetical protein